jgi:hypothetical protein
MSWQTELADKRIKTHTTSRQELDDLRAVIARDLADAIIPALSADRRFATAYNAALQTAQLVIACAGYRVSGLGHHQTSFEAAELALGASSARLMAYFDACRRKRNTVDYDRAHVATEAEAGEVVTQAKAFLTLAETWIVQNYPHWAQKQS